MTAQRSHGQGGQALTEFIVICLVLVPLFLLIPFIAKYQDMAHATEMASRYVAFEAMTRNDNAKDGFKSPTQLKEEVARRFFSNAEAAIKTNDTAGDFAAHRKPFWVDQNGDPLIKTFGNDITVSFGEASGPNHANAYVAANDGEPFEHSAINVRDALGLKAPGLYRANVSITVADLPSFAGNFAQTFETFKNIGLTMTRSTTILVDGWQAADPDQVISRINNERVVPGVVFEDPNKFKPAKVALDPLIGAAELPKTFPVPCITHCGARLGELDFWRDDIPADRRR